jgi:hypothetical protein
MMRVRVQRIESIHDPEGSLGKRIELVEERPMPRFPMRPSSEEGRMVQDVVQALQQQLPIANIGGSVAFPKIILFLTEQEYDELGITFDVNQLYEVDLTDNTIKFKKT